MVKPIFTTNGVEMITPAGCVVYAWPWSRGEHKWLSLDFNAPYHTLAAVNDETNGYCRTYNPDWQDQPLPRFWRFLDWMLP